MMEDAQFTLGEAIRSAIDDALEGGLNPAEIKDEIAFQIENYDWDLA